MSGYRRFVAYVYEYQKQKKGSNRGFVRVENKNGICRFQLQLQCPGLIGQMPCTIYGFIRNKDGIEGIPIGICMTQKDGFRWEMEAKDGQMGKSRRKLEDFGGMVFRTEGGGFYATEWDDREIVPAQFREEKEAPDVEAPRQPEDLAVEEMTEKKLSEPDDWEKDEEETVETEEIGAVREVPKGEKEETFTPFTDGEIVDCRKLDLQETSLLNRADWALRGNRFLLYSYYHFGYLLLGRLRGKPQYILGVPGVYDQQERFMANMFGFPNFKDSPLVELPDGKGGYWYRLINPPNFDQRNR